MSDLKMLLLEKIKEFGLTDSRYTDRLEIEVAEIDKQGLWGYFAELMQRGVKRPNENNLLVAFLLGICDEDPVAVGKDLIWYQSNDFPDVDVDYTPEARAAIKQWMIDEFGEDKVVSIANFATFGIKSGLRDVSRVFEVPIAEVNKVTVPMDNSVNKMEWSDVVKTYPKLADFEAKYPEVCAMVRKLKGRHKAFGTHAAGVVVSDRPLSEQVPLMSRPTDDSTKSKGRIPISQWAEGQATSDLKTFGYVKFDILGLENLNYIDKTLELLGNPPICRKPNSDKDWSDESYLNDPKCLSMANKGDLTTIFQFDSPGIQGLVRSGGVAKFDDLVAYSALYRPGPLNSSITANFVKRKLGKAPWLEDTPDLILPIVKDTMGLCVFQEHNVLTEDGWANLRTMVTTPSDFVGKQLPTYNEISGEVEPGKIIAIWDKGLKECYEITLDDNAVLILTADHIVYTSNGKKKVSDLEEGDALLRTPYWVSGETGKEFVSIQSVRPIGKKPVADISVEGNHNFLIDNGYVVHNCVFQEQLMKIINLVGLVSLPDCERIRKAMGMKQREKFAVFREQFIRNAQTTVGWDEATATQYWEELEDFAGYAFNKSHSVAYTMISARCLYLKAHYPAEYFTAVLSCLGVGDPRISIYMREAHTFGLNFKPVDINESRGDFRLVDKTIYFGFSKIKGIGQASDKLEKLQPYSSFTDYLTRYGLAKTVGEALIKLGAFDKFCPNRNQLLAMFEKARAQKNQKKKQTLNLDEFSDQEPMSEAEKSEYEYAYYGLYFNHPINRYVRQGFTVRAALETAKSGNKTAMVPVEGIISNIQRKQTKNKKPYYLMLLGDETGEIRLLLWGNQYQENQHLFKEGKAVFMSLVPPYGPYPTWNMAKNTIPTALQTTEEATSTHDNEFTDLLRSITTD